MKVNRGPPQVPPTSIPMSLWPQTNWVIEAEPPMFLEGESHGGCIIPVLRSLTFTAGHGLMPCPISLADSREGQQLSVALHGREKHLCWLYRALHALPHIKILLYLPIFSLLSNSCPSAVCSSCCPLPLLLSRYPGFSTGYKLFIAGQGISSQQP